MNIIKRAFTLWGIVLKKQFQIEFSYKTAFFLQNLSIPLTVISWYFLSKLIDDNSPFLSEDLNYFTFVISGVAALDLCVSVINYVAGRIREEQISGVIEEIKITRTSFIMYFSTLSAYPTVLSLIRLTIYMVIIFLVNGYQLNYELLIVAIPILVLTILSLAGFSLISASFILLIKKGDYVTKGYIMMSSLIGGIAYPVAVLPDFVQLFSNFLPVTQLADILRYMFSESFSYELIKFDVFQQIILALIYIILGISVLKFTLKKTLEESSLTDF